MSKDHIAAKLAVVAALAKSLEMDFREGRLWEGDLSSGIGKIVAEAQDVLRSIGHRA